MIRQLEPNLLIENNTQIIQNIYPYVNYVLQIDKTKENFLKIKNVLNFQNLIFPIN